MLNAICCPVCSCELDHIMPSYNYGGLVKYHYNFNHGYYFFYNKNKINGEALNIFNTHFINGEGNITISIIHKIGLNIETEIDITSISKVFVSKKLNFYAIPITNSIEEIIIECKKILLLV